MGPTAIAQIVKDSVTAIAAIVAASVALRGLNTWRRQLIGNAEHTLARSVLLATYKYREAIRQVRLPFVSAGEIAAAYEAERRELPDRRANPEERTSVAAYRQRWKLVSEASAEFDARVLEAETLWGEEIRSHAQALARCVSDLGFALQALLGGEPGMDVARYKSVRAVVYETDGYVDFSMRIKEAIAAIEDEVRPRLKLR
jgi:hypothetical protein